jgi:hypothetical protein
MLQILKYKLLRKLNSFSTTSKQVPTKISNRKMLKQTIPDQELLNKLDSLGRILKIFFQSAHFIFIVFRSWIP